MIQYRECPAERLPVSQRRRLSLLSGAADCTAQPINDGFAGERDDSAANFAKLTRPEFAYTPYVPAGEEHIKVPAWLNDPIYYHNRGNSTFAGESSRRWATSSGSTTS